MFTGRGHEQRKCPRDKKLRNGKIDFLKFIFSLVIVLHHGKNIIGTRQELFLSGGSFAVEFFFIVSGFLMMASISKIKTAPVNIGLETRKYLVKKYKSFCPEIFVAHAIALIVYDAANNTRIVELFIKSFYQGTLFHMTGIGAMSINAAVWYLSSMLLCMAIIYPLLRKYPELSVKYILPLSALLILGYFGGNGRSARAPTEWMGWTYRGNLRAFAELSIGICCYEACAQLKKVDFTVLGKWLLTIAEYTCYFVLLYYMYYYNASRNDYFFILIYAIAIVITFSEKTICPGIYNNKVCYFFGKYSFSLFLAHAFYSLNLNKMLPNELTNSERMLIYIACSLVTGFVVMFISEIIRKYTKYVLEALKKLLVIQHAA